MIGAEGNGAVDDPRSYGGVIPKPGAFTSGARDLARSSSCAPREIPPPDEKTRAFGMTPHISRMQ